MGTEPDDDLFDREPADNRDDDNALIRDLRKRLDEKEKQIKGFTKKEDELNSLRERVQQQEARERVASAEKVFEQAGLPSGLADLFAENYEGDINEEGVRMWAEKRGLTPKPSEDKPETEQTQTFTPTVAGAPSPPSKISRAEFDELMETDPQKATEMARKDQVEWHNPDGVERAIAAYTQR